MTQIVEWLAVYCAAAFAAVQLVALLRDHYQWPKMILTATLVLAAAGVPVAGVLAWYHGVQALRHVSMAELVIIVLLLLVAGLLAFGIRTLLSRGSSELPLVPGICPEVEIASIQAVAELDPPKGQGDPAIRLEVRVFNGSERTLVVASSGGDALLGRSVLDGRELQYTPSFGHGTMAANARRTAEFVLFQVLEDAEVLWLKATLAEMGYGVLDLSRTAMVWREAVIDQGGLRFTRNQCLVHFPQRIVVTRGREGQSQ